MRARDNLLKALPALPHANDGHPIDILAHDQAAWDRQAAQSCEWSAPVGPEAIAAARAGRWQVHLTPGPLPAGWLEQVAGPAHLAWLE